MRGYWRVRLDNTSRLYQIRGVVVWPALLGILGSEIGASVSRRCLSSGWSDIAERGPPPRFSPVNHPVMPISNPMVDKRLGFVG